MLPIYMQLLKALKWFWCTVQRLKTLCANIETENTIIYYYIHSIEIPYNINNCPPQEKYRFLKYVSNLKEICG